MTQVCYYTTTLEQLIELLELPLGVVQLPLDLLPLEEDRTITVAADHLLVVALLTSLAGGPQLGELLLQALVAQQRLRVVPASVLRAGAADDALVQGALAPHASLGGRHELSETDALDGGRLLDQRVVAGEERLRVLDDGLEDSLQRTLKLVLQVPVDVDGQVVLQHVDGVLALQVGRGVLLLLDDDVLHTIADLGRAAGVTLEHSLRQLHMGSTSLVLVVLRLLSQRLGDDQQGNIDVVLQQRGDGVLDVLDGALGVHVNQNLLQAHIDQQSDQTAVITTNGLNALAVHLVPLHS